MFATLRGLVVAALAGTVLVSGVAAAIASTQPTGRGVADRLRTRDSVASCTVSPPTADAVATPDPGRIRALECTPTADQDQSRDRDRLRDAQCAPATTQTRERDRLRDAECVPTADQDRDRTRDQDRLGSCDEAAGSGPVQAGTSADDGIAEQLTVRTRTRTEACAGQSQAGESGSTSQ